MSDRQLQTFFLKFALGVAVALSLELAATHKFLSILLISILGFFVFRCWALWAAWQQLAEFDRRSHTQRGITHTASPINREELILDTYDTALWVLPVLMALLFWLPLHWRELVYAFQN